MKIQKSDQFFLIPIIALVMRLASGPTADISFGLIALYALKGREQALIALFLSWLFSSLSYVVAPEASIAALGRYGVLIAAAISMLIHRRGASISGTNQRLIFMTFLFGCMLVFHSVFFSSMPEVSLLKAISWTLAMTTLLAGWAGLSDDARNKMSQHLFGGLTLVMLVSLPLLAFPAAYFAGGGFMGVLWHSQAFGLTMAFLGAWATARAVTEANPSWSNILMILVCMGLIIMSGTRTAALAFVLGLVGALSLSPVLSGQRSQLLLPGLRSRRLQFCILLVLVVSAVALPRLAKQSETFISKNTEVRSIGQAYQLSRGWKIDEMWMNIDKYPWQGIGFGIATMPELMEIKRDPIFDLPVSAPVEKGVLPVAVIEELGIFGFALFIVWILMLLKRCARRGITALAVFLVAMALNMGEAILFSAGGMGLLAMLLIAWAATGEPFKPRRA